MFSSIPGLYLLDTVSSYDNKKYLWTLSNVPWADKNHPEWKTTDLKKKQFWGLLVEEQMMMVLEYIHFSW